MFHKFFSTLDQRFPVQTASAHCDIPCGIYDPIVAQINALTVVRMIDLINDLMSKGAPMDAGFVNSMSRYIATKEEHAEKAKAEVRVIWGDFFKQPQFDMFPGAHATVHKIMLLGSKARQTVDRDTAVQFVEAINEFAEMFWKAKNVPTKRAKAPYAPNLELVYPVL